VARDDVIVVDSARQFLERVASAVARYALRRNLATIFEQDPFTIQLIPGLDACPRPDSYASQHARPPEVIRVKRYPMHMFNPAQAMFDVIEYFDKVDRKNGGDGLIWVKAIAPRGAQVIVEPKTATGARVKVPAIKPGDPVCLSKYATFEILRDSTDLNQCVTGGLLKLMTHAEVEAYFEKKASILKTSAEDLKAQAEADARKEAMARSRGLSSSEVDKSQRVSSLEGSTEDLVHPRLQALCAEVQPALKPNERMPVSELMTELLALEESITLDDLAYLQAHGFYPTVKKWAETKFAEVAQAQGLIPETDDLS